jgi:hypothetical protein
MMQQQACVPLDEWGALQTKLPPKETQNPLPVIIW